MRATFSKGKLKRVAFFEKDGTPREAGPSAIADWGSAAAKETNQAVVARPEIVTREQWGSKPQALPDTQAHLRRP